VIFVARMTVPGLSWWDHSVQNLLGDVAAAAVAVPLAWHQAQVTPVGVVPWRWGAVVTVATVAAALLVRRRFPLLLAVVADLAVVCSGMWLAVPVATYTVTSRRGNAPATWLTAGAGAVALCVPWGSRAQPLGPTFAALLVVAVVGFPMFVGLWTRQRRQLEASLRERAEQAEHERDLRAARAIAEERNRIARELHDVVAHRISQITVQAGALSLACDARTATVAESIRGTSRTALEEMRELLGVLRRGDDAPPLHPAPTLAGLRQLVADARTARQPVDLDMPDEPPPVAGATGRAIYRLVQESLTNAAKHAPGGAVEVTLAVTETDLTVCVRNAAGLPAALRTGPPPESGLGLAGMRERVELAGGTLTVGPTPEGGFQVKATFPRRPV
jgi:signal transduction histidine kinase